MMQLQSIIHKGEKEALSHTTLKKINIDMYIHIHAMCVSVYIQKEIIKSLIKSIWSQ